MTAVLPPGTTRVEAVMDELLARIRNRRLVAGTRLPTIRALASAMGVSKTTVVDAYQRLAAEGVVFSRRGSGFYVAAAGPPSRAKPAEMVLDRAVDPFWLTFQAFGAGSDTLKPGSGNLPEDWMPQRAIRKALREASQAIGGHRVGDYTPLGFAPLRELVSRRLAERKIEAPYEQVLIVESASQALDYVCRFLLEPGDCVLVDDPCYYNFLALLAAHRVKIVAVPMTFDGPDLDAFAAALATNKPRLYMTNCGFHNPTGVRLSPASAYRLLTLAEAHDLIIVEDDVFADLEHEPSPRLAALAGLSRVICVGGFSKTVSGALRCGYLAACPDWLEPLLILKFALSFGSDRLAAACVHRVLVDASYRRHCETVRTKLAAAMRQTLDGLTACGLTPWLEPGAGMFVWAKLPDGCEANVVARLALEAGMILAPGGMFSTTPGANSFMRFNVATCSQPRIFENLRAALP